MEEKVADMQELSGNIVQIEKQLKQMKFEEMYERMKILQYEKNNAIDKFNDVKKERDGLNINIENIKKEFEVLEIKQKESYEKINELLKETEKKEEIISAQRDKMRLLNKDANDFLEILEFNNSKSLANVKLITQLFNNDENISNTVKNYVMKNLKKYDKTANPLKRELKKNSLFLEEFAKLIVYLRNFFQEKNEKIKELFHSLKISQIMQNNNNTESMKDVILSESEEKPYEALNEQKLHELTEQVNFLKDKFEANKKVENLEKMEDLKDRIQKYKQKIESKNKNEIALNEKISAFKSRLNRNIKLFKRVNKLIIDSLPESVEKELQQENENNQEELEIEVDIEQDKFDYLKYEEKCKENLKLLVEEREKLKEEIEIEKKKMEESLVPIQKEKSENIYKLQNDLLLMEREKEDAKNNWDDCVKRIEILQKQNKELLRNYQKKVVFEVTREKILEAYSMKKYDDMKIEIEKKSKTIEYLLKTNEKMTERLKNLQKERLHILRDRQHCEDLYLYFNKKSTEIFLMNEKLTKIVKENKKLRRFIEELFNMLSQSVKIATEDLQVTDKNLDSVLDEIKNAIFLAASHRENFDPSLFNQFLMERGKETEFKTRKKELSKNVEIKQHEYIKLLEALNSMDRKNIKGGDIDILKKLNQVFVENRELKTILNTQKIKMRDLNKDLLQYKKKAKIITFMEPKIEKLVNQNLELKNLLLQIQNAANEETEVNSNRAINYNNTIDVSGELLEKVIEKLNNENAAKKNLERKLNVLTQQKANLEIKMEKTVNEYEIELTNFLNTIKDKNIYIKQLEAINVELKKSQDQLDEKENEVCNLKKEVENNLKTISLLEENLKVFREKTSNEKEKLKNEIKIQTEKMNVKTDEKANLIDVKYKLESDINNLKEKIEALNDVIANKDTFAQNQKEKLKSLKNENQTLLNENLQHEKEKQRMKISMDQLEEEMELLRKEVKENKEKVNNYLDENSKFVSDERKMIFDKLNDQFKDKIKKLEDQLYETQKNANENVFLLEKKEKEILDLTSKIKMKNKQLIQFNSYINSMADSKNPQLSKLSRLLVQNKSLLREIEHLRNKNKQLQTLYQNLQDSIDSKQISPPSHNEEKYTKKINSLKSSFDTLTVDNYNLKCQFDVLISCYEERLKEIHIEYEKLNNQLIKETDLKLKNEELYLEEKNKKNDLKLENENFKEENYTLLQTNNNFMKENYDLKNKIKKLEGGIVSINQIDQDQKISEAEKINDVK